MELLVQLVGSRTLLLSQWYQKLPASRSRLSLSTCLCFTSPPNTAICSSLPCGRQHRPKGVASSGSRIAVLASFAAFPDPAELEKRKTASKRLESAAKYFGKLGLLGFWGQLVCTTVSAVILVFSIVISGTPAVQSTYYSAAGGIAAGFVSVFWSFGYIRLSNRLKSTTDDLENAPPRAEVVKTLCNGVYINILGMGLTLVGLLAMVGTLVAKALTSPASPYLPGMPPGYTPVSALDVFLVQASGNTTLSHFLGLVFSLELLRFVTKPPEKVVPKTS